MLGAFSRRRVLPAVECALPPAAAATGTAAPGVLRAWQVPPAVSPLMAGPPLCISAFGFAPPMLISAAPASLLSLGSLFMSGRGAFASSCLVIAGHCRLQARTPSGDIQLMTWGKPCCTLIDHCQQLRMVDGRGPPSMITVLMSQLHEWWPCSPAKSVAHLMRSPHPSGAGNPSSESLGMPGSSTLSERRASSFD